MTKEELLEKINKIRHNICIDFKYDTRWAEYCKDGDLVSVDDLLELLDEFFKGE